MAVSALLVGCGSGFKNFPPGTVLSTSATSVAVYPYVNEDLAGPCVFELRLPASGTAVAGTLVVFERGDTARFYNDSSVRQTMDGLQFAMVFAHECDAETTGDLQADASKGPARVLLAAMSELAVSSAHPELASGGLVLFGYSAAGVLTATMLDQSPDRIIGAIEYIPGSAYLDLTKVPISAAESQIPALILANAQDEQSGTTRSRTYFEAGRALHAPWAFGVQHATDHCCSLSTRTVVLPWITALVASRASQASAAPSISSSLFGSFTCTPNKTDDVFGNTNCEFSAAAVQTTVPATGMYGWLPDETSAAAWRTWVLNPATNP